MKMKLNTTESMPRPFRKIDMTQTLERVLTAPMKDRQAALLAAEAALDGNRDTLLVTQAEASRLMSCSRFTIRRLALDGVLHPISIRGMRRYRYSELCAIAEAGTA